MKKTMTTSEFADYIINRFENAAIFRDEYRTMFSIMKAGCYSVISVLEPKSGMTKVTINGKPYSKMTASEKREALEFVNSIEFEKVVDHDVMSNTTMTFNYILGTYTEGQVFMVGDRVWRRIEKVTRIQ